MQSKLLDDILTLLEETCQEVRYYKISVDVNESFHMHASGMYFPLLISTVVFAYIYISGMYVHTVNVR